MIEQRTPATLQSSLETAREVWRGELKVLARGAFSDGSSIAQLTAFVADSYPPISEKAIAAISFATCIFSDAIVMADDIIDYGSRNPSFLNDLPQSLALLTEAYHTFASVLADNANFWNALRLYFSEYVRGLRSEGTVEDWSALSEDDCISIAGSKNGLIRIIDAAIAAASSSTPNGMAEALLDYFVANQMIDDIKDWKEDIKFGRPSLLLRKVCSARPLPENERAIRRAIYTSGAAVAVARHGLARLQSALSISNACRAPNFSTMVSKRALELESFVQQLENGIEMLASPPATATEIRRSDKGDNIERAMRRAVMYLIDMQDDSGAWCDFRVDPGVADAWTTGYVGDAISTATDTAADLEAIVAAIDFLKGKELERGAWGYNDTIPVDADSTAWCLTFLGKAGIVFKRPFQVLARHQDRDSRGFKSYNDLDAHSTWQQPHVDVSAAVAKALVYDPIGDSDLSGLLNYLIQSREETLWPSFWWSTPLYATAHVLDALRIHGRLREIDKTLRVEMLQAVKSQVRTSDPFLLAHGAEIAFMLADETLARNLVESLLPLQHRDGRWMAGSPALRYADPSVSHPWRFAGDRAGRLVYDQQSLFCTATALRALARVHGGTIQL